MSLRNLGLALLVGLATAGPASAFEVFAYPPNQALKWGADNTIGTPGGVVYWSLMPDGTAIDPSFTDTNFSGTSNLTSVFDQLGPGFTYQDALPIFQRAFDQWSAAANITFVPWSSNAASGGSIFDNGSNFNAPGADYPDVAQIRIGAFAINSYAGAVGFAAPPNGGTLAGDILFNTTNLFQLAAGNEGDLIDFYLPPSYYFHNDFEGLFLHELGHAIGMDHTSQCGVMSVDFECYKYLNRELDPDDIAGAQYLYGPAAVPAPPALWLLGTAMAALAGRRLGRPRRA